MDAKYLAEIKAHTEIAKDEGSGLQQFDDLDALIAEVERLREENADYHHTEKSVEGQQNQNARLRKIIDAKDQQIETLKKALEMMYTDNKGYSPDGMGNSTYYIQQAQEQEGRT